MSYILRLFLTLCSIIVLSSTSHAALEGEVRLEDPVKEQQAGELFNEIRCMVCSGESIKDSNASLALDMRRIIRTKLSQGESPEIIRQFFVASYGNQILMTPPIKGSTLLLWGGPLLFLIVGFGVIFRQFNKK